MNGWFVSGITNLQSGPNLQAVFSPDLALGGNTATSANGSTCGNTNTTATGTGNGSSNNACNLDNRTVLGSPDIYLQPSLISTNQCPSGNPATDLAKHQYVNGACFGIPNIGTNGPTNLGYLRAPGFFSSDLSVQRRLRLSESRNLEFRASAFNFLNHPITAFNSHQPKEASLLLSGDSFADARITNNTNTSSYGGGCSAAGTSCFGYAGYKTGRRVMELSARFNF